MKDINCVIMVEGVGDDDTHTSVIFCNMSGDDNHHITLMVSDYNPVDRPCWAFYVTDTCAGVKCYRCKMKSVGGEWFDMEGFFGVSIEDLCYQFPVIKSCVALIQTVHGQLPLEV